MIREIVTRSVSEGIAAMCSLAYASGYYGGQRAWGHFEMPQWCCPILTGGTGDQVSRQDIVSEPEGSGEVESRAVDDARAKAGHPTPSGWVENRLCI